MIKPFLFGSFITENQAIPLNKNLCSKCHDKEYGKVTFIPPYVSAKNIIIFVIIFLIIVAI